MEIYMGCDGDDEELEDAKKFQLIFLEELRVKKFLMGTK